MNTIWQPNSIAWLNEVVEKMGGVGVDKVLTRTALVLSGSIGTAILSGRDPDYYALMLFGYGDWLLRWHRPEGWHGFDVLLQSAKVLDWATLTN